MRRAILSLLVLLPVAYADKWNVSHLHDQDDSSLYLRAIEFPRIKGGKPFDITEAWFVQLIKDLGQPAPVKAAPAAHH